MTKVSRNVIVALAILLTLSYGLSMASMGVSIPGCGAEFLNQKLYVEGSP